jgi:hypothetical protein
VVVPSGSPRAFAVICLAFVGVALVAANAAAQPTVVLPTSAAAGVPVHANEAHPATIIFGADGRTRLLALQWQGWGSATATASGTLEYDVGPAGEPQLQDYPASVTASRLRRCDGVVTYTLLSVTSPGGGVYPTDLTELWRECGAMDSCFGVHAGHPVGDGQYSDGAVTTARNISCGRALALVKPRYTWILKREPSGVPPSRYRPFRLGPFVCRYSFDGPVTLKSCVHGRARFTFI